MAYRVGEVQTSTLLAARPRECELPAPPPGYHWENTGDPCRYHLAANTLAVRPPRFRARGDRRGLGYVYVPTIPGGTINPTITLEPPQVSFPPVDLSTIFPPPPPPRLDTGTPEKYQLAIAAGGPAAAAARAQETVAQRLARWGQEANAWLGKELFSVGTTSITNGMALAGGGFLLTLAAVAARRRR